MYRNRDTFMLLETRRLSTLAWAPMGFCTAISILTIVGMLWIKAVNGSEPGGMGLIVFLCNLPLCFMFVGYMTSHLQREIRDLRDQIAQLQKAKAG